MALATPFCAMVDVKYRLVTDPSEGPKLFQIDTRVTSRGETAVLLTGIDCAERVVCHEAVSFDLAEGEFVFKLGAGNAAAVLDQLLQQGALKINRVFDMGGGRPGPVCVLTPGGSPQPPFGASPPPPHSTTPTPPRHMMPRTTRGSSGGGPRGRGGVGDVGPRRRRVEHLVISKLPHP